MLFYNQVFLQKISIVDACQAPKFASGKFLNYPWLFNA